MRTPFHPLTTLSIGMLLSLSIAPAFAETTVDANSKFDILLRGPVHEAFATPATIDPVDSPIVKRQPPEAIEELLPDHRPRGERVIWIPGYWAFDPTEDDFIWISGVWRNAPPGRQWVPGYWEKAAGGYRWMPGAWVEAGASVAVQAAPPESQERGPSSTRPSNNHFYVPGCWVQQDGRYKWRPGYWVPQQQDWVWVPARYTPTANGYLYSDGYWDYRLNERGRMFAPVRFSAGADAAAPVSYTPTVVLDNQTQLLLHLFAAPTRGQYFFGDYYGDEYATLGIQPWFSSQHNFDPLLSFYVWQNGEAFLRNLQGWNKYFVGHAEYRPRATFSEHLRFLENNADFAHLDRVRIGDTLANVVSSASDADSLLPLSAADRELYGGISQQLSGLTEQRLNLAANATAAADVATEQVLTLPALPKAVVPQLPQALPANPLQLRNVAPRLPLPTGRTRLPVDVPGLPF